MALIERDARLLVVAAHPDDEVLGCGGTIARFRSAGAAVRVVCLAEGITARFEPHQFDQPDVVAQISERAANGRRAIARLGVLDAEIFLEERRCCRMDALSEIDLVKGIERHARDFAPTVVLTHAAHDTNIDHRLVHTAALAAFRPYHFRDLAALLAFEVLSSTEWNPTAPFRADFFVNVSESIDVKIEALSVYGDEMVASPHPRSEEAVRSLARYRGCQAGMEWAEAFQTIRVRA
ncbi:MAG TPA: PIG-L family deacetylase [Hyphomicrobiales bacterium]|mgnify:CR=1 FL=1|nr:PIG-L family deacetylase [Hyphomicrobiales bacterium]